MKRSGLLLAALACASEARAAQPACRAEVLLEPAHALVGQQVRHRVRVERRDEVRGIAWLEPPAFPSARAEALPPEPRPRTTRDGVGYEVYDELHAVFPERSGRLALPGSALRCELADGAQEIRVPGAALEVEAPPAAGRPQDYRGLIGPLLLHLSVTPERVALGQSLRVALMVRGTGNLWQLDAAFPADAFPDAERFERPPELAFERGRELFVRQHLAFDLVPRKAGPLRIPPLGVSYYDPERGGYGVATTPEVMVAVVEPDASALPAPEPLRGRKRAASGAGGRTLALLALGAAGFAFGGVAAWWLRRRRAAEDLPARELANAARARADGDAVAALAAQARALRAALSRHVPGAAALSVEELIAREPSPAVRAAVELLAQVERARYERAAPAPAEELVERAVRALAPGAGGASAALFVLCALLTATLQAGCAGAGHAPGDPMTPARLEALLHHEVEDLEEVDDQLRFVHDGVRMICLWDVRADRLRVVAAVAEESALTVASARILLQANFGNTLDARYAIRDGVLYAVYLHPLSTLDARELDAALDQVASLVRNYGTSFSAAGGR